VNVLAPDCWICRRIASSFGELSKEKIFIAAYVCGYAEGMTTALGTESWQRLNTCAKHQELIKKAATALNRHLEES
jgi:hypothetical protein